MQTHAKRTQFLNANSQNQPTMVSIPKSKTLTGFGRSVICIPMFVFVCTYVSTSVCIWLYLCLYLSIDCKSWLRGLKGFVFSILIFVFFLHLSFVFCNLNVDCNLWLRELGESVCFRRFTT